MLLIYTQENTSMEDSAAMTIEFLRARLLSERSVSRTARQRADELTKRVMELEKQLKILSLQRTKAEKGTANVLAILENHGGSDLYETFDSSSDQEAMLYDSKVGTSSVKGEETSGNKKVGENDVEAFSGSDFESSSLNGRSLSWKSTKESLGSLEKYTDASRRRRSSFASTGSSSPKHVGKSCRQIRPREHRSAVEESKNDASIVLHEDEVATSSEGVHNCSDIGPETPREGFENREEEDLPEVPVSVGLENHRVNNGHYLSNHGGDKDMERALEHQAQLIRRYEAEEKAQREWEDKFRENNGSTPDSYDPGNHSDVTEERDEIKAPAPTCSTEMNTSQNQEAKHGAGDACCSKPRTPNGFQPSPHFDMGCLENQKSSNMVSYKSPASESAFSVAKGKHDEEYLDSHHHQPLQGSHHSPDLHGTSVNDSAHVSSSEGSSLHKGEPPGNTNGFSLIPSENSDTLGSVLEALQQAKLSLKQNLRLPLLEGGSIGRAIEPSVPAAGPGDKFAIPVGSAGLFRLPTDYLHGATAQAKFLGSDSRLSMVTYSSDSTGAKIFSSPYIEARPGTFTGDRSLSVPTFPYPQIRSGVPTRPPVFEPSIESRSSPFTDDRFLSAPTFPYPEFRSGVPTQPSVFEPSLDAGLPSFGNRHVNFDPNLSAGLPSSSQYTHTTHPSYSELMPRMPSDGRLPSFLPSRDGGVPPSTRFSFYDDHNRPYMYR